MSVRQRDEGYKEVFILTEDNKLMEQVISGCVNASNMIMLKTELCIKVKLD